jgi:hypothetical protein
MDFFEKELRKFNLKNYDFRLRGGFSTLKFPEHFPELFQEKITNLSN